MGIRWKRNGNFSERKWENIKSYTHGRLGSTIRRDWSSPSKLPTGVDTLFEQGQVAHRVAFPGGGPEALKDRWSRSG